MLLVELSPRALRDLKRLPERTRDGIIDDLRLLEAPPWPPPPKVKKLRGHDLYRIWTGDSRSVFEKRADRVVVLRIVDRKEFDRILQGI